MGLKITKHYKDFQGFVRKTKQCRKATMISGLTRRIQNNQEAANDTKGTNDDLETFNGTSIYHASIRY